MRDESSESQYTENWRSALYALRLIGRLHDLKRNDPKPVEPEKEENGASPLPLPGITNHSARKRTILRRKERREQ